MHCIWGSQAPNCEWKGQYVMRSVFVYASFMWLCILLRLSISLQCAVIRIIKPWFEATNCGLTQSLMITVKRYRAMTKSIVYVAFISWCKFIINSHWKHRGIVHFQVQWTRYDGSSKVNISYLFWTLRMSSLCICGPFSFCPLSVHRTHCLQRMAVLVDSVSNATQSHPSLNAMIPFDLWSVSVPWSYPVFWSIQCNVHVEDPETGWVWWSGWWVCREQESGGWS